MSVSKRGNNEDVKKSFRLSWKLFICILNSTATRPINLLIYFNNLNRPFALSLNSTHRIALDYGNNNLRCDDEKR